MFSIADITEPLASRLPLESQGAGEEGEEPPKDKGAPPRPLLCLSGGRTGGSIGLRGKIYVSQMIYLSGMLIFSIYPLFMT